MSTKDLHQIQQFIQSSPKQRTTENAHEKKMDKQMMFKLCLQPLPGRRCFLTPAPPPDPRAPAEEGG